MQNTQAVLVKARRRHEELAAEMEGTDALLRVCTDLMSPASPVVRIDRSEWVRPAIAVVPEAPKGTQRTRIGKRAISTYLEPDAFKAMHQISLDEGLQLQELMHEALRLLFASRGVDTIVR